MTASANQVEALLRIASQLREGGQYAEAVVAYEKALRAAPLLPTAWYNLGLCQRMSGRLEAALQSYQKAIALGLPGAEEAHLNRAAIFADALRREADAERELEQALRLNPSYVPALLNLANLHEDFGRRAAAVELYERALALDPVCWTALARLGNLLPRGEALTGVTARLRQTLERNDVVAEDRASLGFALGRGLDAAGDYAAAFEAYRHANRESRAAARSTYDRAAAGALNERIMAAFPRASARAEETGWAPIFICGMFRSGSTLVEQVLAGHKRISPCGELALMPSLVRDAVGSFPEQAAMLDAPGCADLAREYRVRISRLFAGADLITDKWLDNWLYVGLIKRMFPAAKIVHTVRNPLDNVLSVFFLHLDPSIVYAFDLGDVAHQLRISRQLMAHWRSLYGEDIIEFDYDAFVARPRETAERLVRTLGLEWDEECLAFHRRDNAVKTASVWQVREQLYATSSGRWRNYARELEGVRSEIASDL